MFDELLEEVERYPDGTEISTDPGHDLYYAKPPDSQMGLGGSFQLTEFDTERQARLWADVQTITGGFNENLTDRHGVPPKVAVSKTRVTVAYLASRGFGTDDIAGFCGTKPESIHSYISRVRSDAADIRDS